MTVKLTEDFVDVVIFRMSQLIVERLSALQDNYVFVLHVNEKTAVVDPSEAEPVWNFLENRGWKLDFIFNTHHHWDHVGGNKLLKERSGCQILTSRYDKDRIEGADAFLVQPFQFGGLPVDIIEIPGHTLGHIALWFSTAKALFCGDTLFGLGCGRLFEGTPKQMWTSLLSLRNLPDDTRVYCGHEYTIRNCEFALSLEPSSQDLKKLLDQLKTLNGTVPTRLGDEKRFNPFLRVDDVNFKQHLGFKPDADPVEVFASIREMKNKF